jgi:hypothetical protein
MTPCNNAAIIITNLTDDIIEGYCDGCKRNAVANRKHYSKEQWAIMLADAKKHQNGEFND